MATTRALEAVCGAVATLLDDAAATGGFTNVPSFSVISSAGIDEIGNGAGVLPYRIDVNGTYRHPKGSLSGTTHRLAKLPVDLHFLLIVGAADATAKLNYVGWIMRKLEDHPVLPTGLLNQADTVFDLGEVAEVSFEMLPNEELLHLWEVMGQDRYDQVLLPYVTRNIQIESELDQRAFADVQERLYRNGLLTEVGVR